MQKWKYIIIIIIIGKSGTIKDTPFQAELRLKVGANVMLTYNVDTADG